ncbi:AraC family transcriptional regulator [Saccharopolyspora mangrovi]|uniref:AraC family transcriptional regulator n=1 Tax=Saccharopolyspora mangrovi TaxID=3082379 RepID=A0ABU6ABZ1_9PSEU|nr:AraC family transcriptional regulator [Saccharopolyspora sp. S2-29]MEB3369083.1 AraC family transcriptional regulator [Saccharopolyspora sp. S2-29]
MTVGAAARRGPGETASPVRELVVPDPSSSVRWHQHDWPHPLARWHHHPEVEVHLIRESSGTVMVGDYVGPFGPGHLSLIGSYLPHNWISHFGDADAVPRRDVVLQLDQDRFFTAAETLPELESLRPLLDDAARGVEFSGRTAVEGAQALEAVQGTFGLRRLAAVAELLGVLADSPESDRRYLDSHGGSYRLGVEETELFNRALSYITDHLADRMLLTDVAEEVGLSRDAFSRLFSKATGVGFSRTVSRMRLTEASRLLRTSDLPVAEICYRVGFTNLSNFNRQFRVTTGTTPSQYRRIDRR